MKGFAMLEIGKVGWIEKEAPSAARLTLWSNRWLFRLVLPISTLYGKVLSVNATI